MRHGKKFNHLSRTAAHRKAMLSNMATSLILHRRIVTTVAKAKALRSFVEPLITKAKEDTTHSRRVVFRYLQDKESVKALFEEVSDKIGQRPGGYTRILKTGNRLGDNADMCVMELVDYNEALLKESKPAKSKTRRSRRGGKAATAAAAATTTQAVVEDEAVVEEAIEEAEVVEEQPVDDHSETPSDDAIEDQAEESEEAVSEATEMEDESSSKEEGAESGEEE